MQADEKWKVLERPKITVKPKSSSPYQRYHGATEDKLIKMLDDTGRDRRIPTYAQKAMGGSKACRHSRASGRRPVQRR